MFTVKCRKTSHVYFRVWLLEERSRLCTFWKRMRLCCYFFDVDVISLKGRLYCLSFMEHEQELSFWVETEKLLVESMLVWYVIFNVGGRVSEWLLGSWIRVEEYWLIWISQRLRVNYLVRSRRRNMWVLLIK